MINNFFKKVNITEILTIISIFSIGISLLYKHGFYRELGIGWYLYTLSPQQIFLTSISLVLFSILGAILGAFIAFLDDESSLFGPIVFYILMGIIVFSNIIGINSLISGLYILSISAYIVMALTEVNLKKPLEQSQKLSLYIPEENSFSNKIGRPLLSILLIIGLLWLIHLAGEREAQQITNANTPKNLVKLKNSNEEWLLIEMTGDKVLMMRDIENREFKITEYKDIDSIKIN